MGTPPKGGWKEFMSQASVEESLELARDAVSRGAWYEAYDLFSALDTQARLGAADLERLGDAAGWTAHLDACIDARERAYAACMAGGEKRRAAGLALALARDYEHKLLGTVASGWLSRAERILADEPECPEQGYLARWRSLQALARGDYEQAVELAQQPIDIGTRQGDPDVTALGLMQRAQPASGWDASTKAFPVRRGHGGGGRR
jgi:hypothetical protein